MNHDISRRLPNAAKQGVHTRGSCEARTRRPGFTLVELMVTITIIAILAGMLLGALYASAEAAERRRTQALIRKLHDQIAIRWESYETRRLPIDPTKQTVPNGVFSGTPGAFPEVIENNFATPGSPTDAEAIAARTLLARRELMRMELPDHYSDFRNVALPTPPPPIFTPQFLKVYDPSIGLPTNDPGAYKAVAPSLWQSYQRRVARLQKPSESLADVYDRINDENQSAECLYLILTSGMGSDGGAVFSERDSGDTDQDGMREFIDGWGNPIEWIRWPAGFISDMQPAVVNTSGANPTVTRNPLSNPNAFDTRRIDPPGGKFNALQPRGYALFPLVVSSGPDGLFGLAFRWNPEATAKSDPYALLSPIKDAKDDLGAPVVSPRQRGETLRFVRDPTTYKLSDNTLSGDFGYNGYELDNIHNHQLNQ